MRGGNIAREQVADADKTLFSHLISLFETNDVADLYVLRLSGNETTAAASKDENFRLVCSAKKYAKIKIINCLPFKA
jgi:hypothetical protein